MQRSQRQGTRLTEGGTGRRGQNEESFCALLTVPVDHGGAAGVEGRPALQVSLILPLLLLLRRLVRGFDMVLQHGKATDGTRHLGKSGREKVQMSLNSRYLKI